LEDLIFNVLIDQHNKFSASALFYNKKTSARSKGMLILVHCLYKRYFLSTISNKYLHYIMYVLGNFSG